MEEVLIKVRHTTVHLQEARAAGLCMHRPVKLALD
jgi:hypothetical protein